MKSIRIMAMTWKSVTQLILRTPEILLTSPTNLDPIFLKRAFVFAERKGMSEGFVMIRNRMSAMAPPITLPRWPLKKALKLEEDFSVDLLGSCCDIWNAPFIKNVRFNFNLSSDAGRLCRFR